MGDCMPYMLYDKPVKVLLWELTVLSCSKIETSRVTRSVKFSGKGSISEPGKSTGCSVSEPKRNLVNRNEVTDLLVTEGRLEHLS